MQTDRPPVVCLCGSLRFMDLFDREKRRLTALGVIVLAPEPIDTVPTSIERATLGELHLRRIDLADEVRVVAMDGYVGATTKQEIAYARRLGKHVTSIDPLVRLYAPALAPYRNRSVRYGSSIVLPGSCPRYSCRYQSRLSSTRARCSSGAVM